MPDNTSDDSTSDEREEQNSIQGNIFKWLIIILVVLLLFASVLMALGYLLNENEKKTKAQITEIRNTEALVAETKSTEFQSAKQERNVQEKVKKKAEEKSKAQLFNDLARLRDLEQAKQIIVNNLVCQDVRQCHFVDTGTIELGCVVAVNAIGKSMLTREQFTRTFSLNDEQCEEQISELSLTCRHNICSIE